VARASTDPTSAGSTSAGSTSVAPVSVSLVFFAAARRAAGTSREDVQGATVADVLTVAEARHGRAFAQVVAKSRVWVNGEPAALDWALAEGDEVAVLPPVSGGE
jgi:sulfur-carrier protein